MVASKAGQQAHCEVSQVVRRVLGRSRGGRGLWEALHRAQQLQSTSKLAGQE